MDANQDSVDASWWDDFINDDSVNSISESQFQNTLPYYHDNNFEDSDFLEPQSHDSCSPAETTIDFSFPDLGANGPIDYTLLESPDFKVDIHLHLETDTVQMQENSNSGSSTGGWTPFSRESSSLPTSSGGSDALCVSPGVMSFSLSPSVLLSLPDNPLDPSKYDNSALQLPTTQPPPSPVTTPAPRARRRGNCLKIPTRVQRTIDKPVKCMLCGHGHAYRSDLKKHIIANHKEHAVEIGLSVLRHKCHLCNKTFARSDHLKRHLDMGRCSKKLARSEPFKRHLKRKPGQSP
jgi:hypothetical protein